MKTREHGLLDEPLDHLALVPVSRRLELDLPGRRRERGAEVRDPRHGERLAEPHRPAEGVRHEVLVVADRHADADPAPLADLGAPAGEVRQLGDDLLHVRRHLDLVAVRSEARGLLVHDADLVGERPRVVRAHLRAEAVLERGDDAPAVRVVLGIRRGDDEEVERQAHQVASDLDVSLLHDVEEPHLDALGEIRQLVQDEDAAVRPREQAVVDRQLVGEVPALGDLDRIHLADQVGDRDVGRGELLPVPALPGQPLDGGAVAQLGDERAPGLADGLRADRR